MRTPRSSVDLDELPEKSAFNGVIDDHELTRGSYQLTATPAANGGTGP